MHYSQSVVDFFIYLIDVFGHIQEYSVFHLHNGRQHFGGRKQGSTWGRSTTISGMMEELPTDSGREGQHELDELTATTFVRDSRFIGVC